MVDLVDAPVTLGVMRQIFGGIVQVGVQATQINRRNGAHGAIRGHSTRQTTRRNAHPHTALHNGQQLFALQLEQLEV